jgi:hypothetical protein
MRNIVVKPSFGTGGSGWRSSTTPWAVARDMYRKTLALRVDPANAPAVAVLPEGGLHHRGNVVSKKSGKLRLAHVAGALRPPRSRPSACGELRRWLQLQGLPTESSVHNARSSRRSPMLVSLRRFAGLVLCGPSPACRGAAVQGLGAGDGLLGDPPVPRSSTPAGSSGPS